MRLRLLAPSRRWFLRSLAGALVLTWAVLPSPARSDGFILVRSAKNANVTLRRAQVKEMALGKKKAWPHGPVVLLVLTRPGTPELRWFASSIVGLPESTLMARIKEQVFKGEMRKPVIAASEQELLNSVANDEGAIGAVRSEAGKNLPAGVSVLSLQ